MKDKSKLENEHFEWVTTRTYWDIYAHQFKGLSPEDKLVKLALYLKEGGDLHYALEEYKVGRADYILNCLNTTIYYYLDYIRTGKPADIMSYVFSLYLSEHQLIQILAAELKERLYYKYEGDHTNPGKRIYKMRTGGYDITPYLYQEHLSKKERLISAIKGELPDDFDVGYFDDDIDFDED